MLKTYIIPNRGIDAMVPPSKHLQLGGGRYSTADPAEQALLEKYPGVKLFIEAIGEVSQNADIPAKEPIAQPQGNASGAPQTNVAQGIAAKPVETNLLPQTHKDADATGNSTELPGVSDPKAQGQQGKGK